MAGTDTPTGGEGAAPASASKWDERLTAFATAVKKDPTQIASALTALVGEAGDDALVILSDPSAVTDDDLKTALVSGSVAIPLGMFRKHLAVLRGPQIAATTVGTAQAGPASVFGNLPEVPNDASFLEALKTGGVLRPGETEVILAAKAALASAVGLYELPALIAEKMEEFAEQQDIGVTPRFFQLRKMVTKREYAEVLSALGATADFATPTRRKNFLAKLNTLLWPSVVSFHRLLEQWQKSWTASAGNLGFLALGAAAMPGASGSQLLAAMSSAPDASGIRGAAEGVIDTVNRIFGGMGMPVARVLAADAIAIKQVLNEPDLPMAIGAANRDQMIKMLGIKISSDYVRLELNVARYLLATVNLPRVAAGNDETGYLIGMIQLGSAIPWDMLPSGSDFDTVSSPMRRRDGGRELGIGRGVTRGAGNGDDDQR